jgi:hypothetical protein
VQSARILAYNAQKIAQLGFNTELAAREAASANQQLARLDSLLATGQFEQAHEIAASALLRLERAASELRRLVSTSDRLESNPLSISTDTLAEFATLQRSVESMRPRENLLAGGDFEDLSEMTQLGWQHLASNTAGARTTANLSPVEPQHGRYCLELKAAADSENFRRLASNHLVWIVSPPMVINPNQIIEISGWVRVDATRDDGGRLEILDSLGGPALSLVAGQTTGWRPFRMIRATTEPSQIRVTFALTGVGSAKVDAVVVRTLEAPLARRLPPAERASVKSR